MNKLLIFGASLLFCISSLAQNSDRPSVFMDCETWCFRDYVRQNITFIDYSLERMDADIYVLFTALQTGGGGREIQMVIQGNEQFENRADTTTFYSHANDTEVIRRNQLVAELKKGLLPFIVQTSLINDISFSVASPDTLSEENLVEEEDPWDYWVFGVGGNGWFNGEETYKSADLNGNVNATRITEESKFTFRSRVSLNRTVFTLTDGEEFVSEIESYNTNALFVKSINDHWSAGVTAGGGSSTFSNMELRFSGKAAVEYNIFPYDDAQTKRFSIRYAIGPEYYNYTDTTIYDKLEETVFRHGLDVEITTTQKMGDLNLDLGVEQYLHDPRLYNVYISPGVNWQLFKGFRVNLFGFASLVNDRINIPKDVISDEDILLQQRQLDTQFSYYTSVGINYRFGSDKNNFVNARF